MYLSSARFVEVKLISYPGSCASTSRYIASLSASRNLRCSFHVVYEIVVRTLRLREYDKAVTSTSGCSNSISPSFALCGSKTKSAILSRPRFERT